MSKLYLGCLTAFLLASSPLLAQQQWLGGQISPQEKAAFERRVKDIGQLISRFNFEQDLQGQPMQTQVLDSQFVKQREQAMRFLFDYGKYSRIGEEELKQVERFTQFVNRPDTTAYFLDFYDKNWYAVVTVKAKLNGQPVEMRLTLQPEMTGKMQSKWVLVGAKADFLAPKGATKAVFLPPNSDGNNFIGLADALENKEEVLGYARKNFQVDHLSLVLAHLQTGALTQPQITKTTFHFLQINGWGMVVEEYNNMQQQPNSGWLIADVFPLLNKKAYQQYVLGIP